MGWKPEEDGVTHINVYSKCKTVLGNGCQIPRENHSNPKVIEPKDGRWVIDFIGEFGS